MARVSSHAAHEWPERPFSASETRGLDAWADAVLAVMTHEPAACISVTHDPGACDVAERLERALGRPTAAVPRYLRRHGASAARSSIDDRRRVLLVTTTRARTRAVLHMRRSLELAGNEVVGLLLVD